MIDIYSLYKNDPMLVKSIIKSNNHDKLLVCCKKSGNSLLHILVDEGDIEGFKAIICMLKEIKNTNKCLFKKIINKQNLNGDTPAHIAVRKSKGKNNIYSIMVETLEILHADFTIPNNNKEIIKKLDKANYDSNHGKIKEYINHCLFGDTYDNKYNEDIETDNNNYYIPKDLDEINTSSPIILEVFVNKTNQNGGNQDGGKQKYSESESSTDSEFIGRRKLYNPYMKGGSKQSQKIHDDIINKIKNMGYNEQDAKDIKNVIYYEVKEKYPKLNNIKRAEKMIEVIDKKLANINMNEIRKELEKYRERNNNNSKQIQKEPTKETKKETKKKSSKRSSKKYK
jgi:hypothetical protein